MLLIFKQQLLKDGQKVIFGLRDFTAEEFEEAFMFNADTYNNQEATVEYLETYVEPGERDHEYHTIKFSDGEEWLGVSGYHLEECK